MTFLTHFEMTAIKSQAFQNVSASIFNSNLCWSPPYSKSLTSLQLYIQPQPLPEEEKEKERKKKRREGGKEGEKKGVMDGGRYGKK